MLRGSGKVVPSLGESIRAGTKWILTGNVSTRVIEFVGGIALARILIPADFGHVVTVGIFTGLAAFIAGGGMGQAIVRADSVSVRDYRVVFTLQVCIALAIYSLFFLTAPLIAHFFEDEIYIDLVRVAALNFLIRPFQTAPRALLQREMRFRPLAIINVVGVVVGTLVSIVLALAGFGPWSLILTGLLGSLLGVLLLARVMPWSPGLVIDWEVARRMGSYGFKISLNELVGYVKRQTTHLLVSKALGPGPLGLYNKASSLSELPVKVIAGSTYQTVFRALAQEQANLDRARYLYLRTVALVAVYTFPFYVGLWWLAEPFIYVVYGEKWLPAAAPLQVLALGGFLRCLANPSGAVLAAHDRLMDEIRAQLESWVFLVVGVLIALRYGDITTVAWVVLGVAVYTVTRLLFIAGKTLRVAIADLYRALQPSLLLNGLLFLVLWMATLLIGEVPRWMELLILSGLGGLSYALAFLFLPIPALESEARRWKVALRLSRSA